MKLEGYNNKEERRLLCQELTMPAIMLYKIEQSQQYAGSVIRFHIDGAWLNNKRQVIHRRCKFSNSKKIKSALDLTQALYNTHNYMIYKLKY